MSYGAGVGFGIGSVGAAGAPHTDPATWTYPPRGTQMPPYTWSPRPPGLTPTQFCAHIAVVIVHIAMAVMLIATHVDDYGSLDTVKTWGFYVGVVLLAMSVGAAIPVCMRRPRA